MRALARDFVRTKIAPFAAQWDGCLLFTEPRAGSGAASQRTRAVCRGDEYVLNGTAAITTEGTER